MLIFNSYVKLPMVYHLVMKRGNGKSKIFMEALGKSIAMSDYRRAAIRSTVHLGRC
jgi:hypothetical protein